MEIFKLIPSTKDTYEASNLGNIRRVGGNKILSQKTKSNKYKEVNLYVDKIGKSRYVHRLVAEAFLGDLGDKIINHKDGVKDNNNIENLEMVTYSENRVHSYMILGNKIRTYRGSSHGMAKLNEEIVLKIREDYKLDKSIKKISIKYNLPYGRICSICYRCSWKHI